MRLLRLSLRASFALVLVGGPLLGCAGDPGEGPLAPPAIPDEEHGPITDADIDGDGIANDNDNCPSVANADQRRACTYPEVPRGAGTIGDDAVARLDWYRTLVGLPGVTEDAVLTRGCMLHVSYLEQLSDELGGPVLSHTEDLSRPYASAEGNQAGIDSVLSYGRGDIGEAIDGWMNTLYHRLPLIHPGLTRIGAHFSGGFGCVQYRGGTDDSAVAPHPILWPPPDIAGTDRTFGGNESPCPTVADPLGGGPCPGSAAIPSLGLHGLGRLANATGTLTRLDTGAQVSLMHVFFDGGPSTHERQGYLEGTVALVPEAGSSLDRAPYEVRVDVSVAGAPSTYRWRFRTDEPLPEVECTMGHASEETAIVLAPGPQGVTGRVCSEDVWYRLAPGPDVEVVLRFDNTVGDLDLAAFDAAGAEVGRSVGTTSTERMTVPGGSFVRVYGFGDEMGTYVLSVR